MTTSEMVRVYISQFCAEAGCTPESVYSKESNSWFFKRGSASVEIFMSQYETVMKTVRIFVRCFSPVCPLPVEEAKMAQLYQEALQNNTSMMGVKLCIMPEKGYMYALAERDIEGMDYTEFQTLVGDLGYWADQLDDILQTRFGAPVALN